MKRFVLILSLCVAVTAGEMTLAQESEICAVCGAKAWSTYRSDYYLERARAAPTMAEKEKWILIALRFDPSNDAAKQMLAELQNSR